MEEKKQVSHTRTLSPRLGLLGFLGFLGFAGFLPFVLQPGSVANAPPFFIFFCFFGFFGFYYEGKMSGTLMDERFLINRYRAASIANQTGLVTIIAAAILTLSVLRLSTNATLGVLTAVIGLAFGLSVFLQQYLLYRFENEE